MDDLRSQAGSGDLGSPSPTASPLRPPQSPTAPKSPSWRETPEFKIGAHPSGVSGGGPRGSPKGGGDGGAAMAAQGEALRVVRQALERTKSSQKNKQQSPRAEPLRWAMYWIRKYFAMGCYLELIFSIQGWEQSSGNRIMVAPKI